MATPTLTQLTTSLNTLGLPTPSADFLTPILRPAPLPSLIATAKIRLLSSNITLGSILHESTPILPPNITNPHVASTTLRDDVFVQVLDIEDIGRSKWEQIEALEAERKGETTKGREVIRVVPVNGDGDERGSSALTQNLSTQNLYSSSAASRGPFKLLLQDSKGQKVYAFELKRVEKIGLPPVTSIGCKIMLKKRMKVARGMLLLEPSVVVVLGGKIEQLDKGWREGREQRLRAEVESERPRE